MVAMFPPPFCPVADTLPRMRARGYAVLAPTDMAQGTGTDLAGLALLVPSWDRLEADGYLKDGGRYRRRRHACFVVEGDDVRRAPHRAHWQSLDYNALHGGMQRWFEPVAVQTSAQPAWRRVISAIAGVCDALRGPTEWSVEAHQFRIDTADGIGRPTPEGAHRDGVDFVAVLLLARHHIKGGETRVFEADGPNGLRFTLEAPWSLMLMDDARVIHESTPIQPLGDTAGHRDTLVLTFRSAGFLGDAEV